MVAETDEETLAGAIEQFARRGFTESLSVVGNRLRGVETRKTFRPEDVVIREYRRFEGVSDPDDMSIVYLLLGGEIPAGKGAFYPPTLLTAVDKGMPAFDEETFGPVAAVVRAKDEADAVRLANESAFGLGASLWTRDRARAERLAAQVEAGSVFVNGLVKSDPRLPFGGIKRSGYGRELSEYGIREFVNVKSVWIA